MFHKIEITDHRLEQIIKIIRLLRQVNDYIYAEGHKEYYPPASECFLMETKAEWMKRYTTKKQVRNRLMSYLYRKISVLSTGIDISADRRENAHSPST